MGGEPDLLAVMLEQGVTWRSCQRLMELGIEGKYVAELGAACAIGQARVQLLRTQVGGIDLWEMPGPDARLLLAAHDHGEIADIFAVSTSHPGQVARCTGFGWCLGFDVIEDAQRAKMAGRRMVVRLVADPLEWLRARGRAVWVADWALALPVLRDLGEGITLQCDAGAGARVKALLHLGGLPKVSERAPVAKLQREAA